MHDSFDLRILTALQTDARTPMTELAEQVGLSAPACYRRVRALRASGAITREAALVAPRTMGWPITMIVLVMLERDHSSIIDELIATLQSAPEVLDIWYITGGVDLVLQVAARDMAAYEQFTRRTFHAHDHVRSFKTLVVMQHAKQNAPLPPA